MQELLNVMLIQGHLEASGCKMSTLENLEEPASLSDPMCQCWFAQIVLAGLGYHKQGALNNGSGTSAALKPGSFGQCRTLYVQTTVSCPAVTSE